VSEIEKMIWAVAYVTGNGGPFWRAEIACQAVRDFRELEALHEKNVHDRENLPQEGENGYQYAPSRESYARSIPVLSPEALAMLGMVKS